MKKLLYIIIGLIIPFGSSAQENGEVKSMQVITINQSTSTSYGSSVASYSANKIMAGSVNGTNNGEVFIHTLNPNGTVQSSVRITRNEGGFGDHPISGHSFGSSVVNVGDLNGDGIDDIAVGARFASNRRGAVWFLYLDANGQVIGERRLTDTTTGFGSLSDGDYFGTSITNIGDIDGNGFDDIAVGSPYNSAATSQSGSVYIILLEKDGKVKSHTRINDNNNLFGISHFRFGASVTSIGDIDGDGITDIAVGEIADGKGKLWILFLNSNGTLKNVKEIGEGKGGFTDSLQTNTLFGYSVTNLGDMDGDGKNDIAVGAIGRTYKDSISSFYGAVWVLFLNSDGTVKKNIKIGNGTGGFTGNIKDGDRFGWSVSRVPDLDGDSVPELAVGSTGADAAVGGGAVYILFLKGVPQVSVPHIEAPSIQVQVYPNPATDILHFDFGQTTSSQATVQLFDSHGRLLLSQQLQTHSKPSINVSGISTTGVYYLQIECGRAVVYKKVVIE